MLTNSSRFANPQSDKRRIVFSFLNLKQKLKTKKKGKMKELRDNFLLKCLENKEKSKQRNFKTLFIYFYMDFTVSDFYTIYLPINLAHVSQTRILVSRLLCESGICGYIILMVN